jgi:hypothetical protein
MKLLFLLCVGIHHIYSSNYLQGLIIEEPQYGEYFARPYTLFKCRNISI